MLALAAAFMPENSAFFGEGGGGIIPDNIYLRPGGVDFYNRPDGTSYYIRP